MINSNYLLDSLIDELKGLLEELPVTIDNYKIAKAQLQSRCAYQNSCISCCGSSNRSHTESITL